MLSLRFLSLERKLALLITGVIMVVVAASVALTYGILTHSTEIEVGQRLVSAAKEVAKTAAEATRDRSILLQANAENEAIARVLTVQSAFSPGGTRNVIVRARATARVDSVYANARRVLSRLQRPNSSRPIELWDTLGQRVMVVGQDVPIDTALIVAEARRVGAESLPPVRRPGLAGLHRTDSVVTGNFYAEDSSVVYWAVATIRRDKRTIGYLAQQLRFSSPPAAAQSLRDLTGESITMFMRNLRGDLWAAAPGIVSVPREPGDEIGSARFYRSPEGDVIGAEARLDSLPWVAFLETPVSAVHQRTRRLLLTILGLGLLLTIVGAITSLLIGRRVVQPLTSLTHAVEAIARGDYARRVPSSGGDEIGRLAVTFNAMAAEVESARTELQHRLEDTRASAGKLEQSNEQLQAAMLEADRLREEAQHANRAKSDFLAVMSHELRTPLNAIGGYAQLIDLGVHGPVSEAQHDALTRIARSQAHLLRLINDVLNFARVDAGQVRYTMTDVPLGETLAGLEALIAPQLRAKSLHFSFTPCPNTSTVYADSDKLQQIVLNLLTNAIKFTPEGGSIAIECECDPELVRVRVRDSGVGVPAERTAAIFDPFVQLDRSVHQSTEGVGLGLAISRDLARGMSGDLEVESIVGEGSTFTLVLPARHVPGARRTRTGPMSLTGEHAAIR